MGWEVGLFTTLFLIFCPHYAKEVKKYSLFQELLGFFLMLATILQVTKSGLLPHGREQDYYPCTFSASGQPSHLSQSTQECMESLVYVTLYNLSWRH